MTASALEWKEIARQILRDGPELTELRIAFEDACAVADMDTPRVWRTGGGLWQAHKIPDPLYVSRTATCIAIALSNRK